MPRNIIGEPPFDVLTIDSDVALNISDIEQAMEDRTGVSVCVRSATGHERRGGYFFHIERAEQDYNVFDFEKNLVGTLNPTDLMRFINHVSGRLFDQDMLTYCQSVVNLRQDQTAPDTEV